MMRQYQSMRRQLPDDVLLLFRLTSCRCVGITTFKIYPILFFIIATPIIILIILFFLI